MDKVNLVLGLIFIFLGMTGFVFGWKTEGAKWNKQEKWGIVTAVRTTARGLGNIGIIVAIFSLSGVLLFLALCQDIRWNFVKRFSNNTPETETEIKIDDLS